MQTFERLLFYVPIYRKPILYDRRLITHNRSHLYVDVYVYNGPISNVIKQLERDPIIYTTEGAL